MSDDRREADRRAEDVRLAEAVEDLGSRFDRERERATATHARIEEAIATHEHREIIRLIDVLEGSATIMPSGEVIRHGGLIEEVASLTRQIRNGGIRIRLPGMAWAAIWAAVITGISSIFAALAG